MLTEAEKSFVAADLAPADEAKLRQGTPAWRWLDLMKLQYQAGVCDASGVRLVRP